MKKVVKCQLCDLPKDLCELMAAEKEIDGMKVTYCCENKKKKE